MRHKIKTSEARGRRDVPRSKVTPGRPPDRLSDAVTRSNPPTEDFGARPDIETADEPVEEHDRRHHDRDQSA